MKNLFALLAATLRVSRGSRQVSSTLGKLTSLQADLQAGVETLRREREARISKLDKQRMAFYAATARVAEQNRHGNEQIEQAERVSERIASFVA